MSIPILLTATVYPQIRGAFFTPEERLQQYVTALQFYKSKKLKIVFAENSGSIEKVRQLVGDSEFIEYLDVSDADYKPERGKGYNEFVLINKAVELSKFIDEEGCFFKITGRLRLLNVRAMLRECKGDFRADCKDHNLYKYLRIKSSSHKGECRYWYVSKSFYLKHIVHRYVDVNDYPPKVKTVMRVMLELCREFRHTPGCKDRFWIQAVLSGKGGHSLGKGSAFFHSTDCDSFALRSKAFIRQILRIVLPWVRL